MIHIMRLLVGFFVILVLIGIAVIFIAAMSGHVLGWVVLALIISYVIGFGVGETL